MTPAPLPPDEDVRLAVLHGFHILDTDPEPAFDDLTALAATICGTPVAMISFVDAERQWFKSAYGVEDQETPRDVAFCAHAILDPLDFFFVPDTHEDPRFAGSPLVVGSPHIRGYAAAVLRVGSSALGTLCVVDRQPLALSQDQVDALRRLGRQVVAQLRLRENVSLLRADIAKRERVERELAASERRFRHVVENVREVIFETDVVGSWRYLNPAWTEVTGFAVQDSLGRPFSQFLPVTELSNHHHEFGQLLEGAREVCRYEIQCRTKGGEYRWLEVHARLAFGDDGQIAGTTGTLRDVTDQRRLADQIVQAREDAVAASRLKSEFLANMSHEIRTPINGVIGLASILLDTRLTRDQRECAEGVMQSANALLTIVNDVLDLSKIEAGKLLIDPIAFEMNEMIAGALAPVTVKADSKGLTIETRLDPRLPAWVTGDPVRIRQVLINLVDNAVKFTERGVIIVRVEALASADDSPLIRFSIADPGVGIPSDKLSAIFEKFTQADNSTTRRYGGTGLGLTICRQLVELMKGDIGVESTSGTGSRFHFAVPLPEVAAPPAPVPASNVPTAAVASRTLHVLLAEDNRINQTVAKRLLEKAGCVVDVVENGELAIERVRSKRYDAIFMDCQMPVMDGYEATRRIRSLPGCATLPIVALTAHAMEGDRERCLEAGMTDYLAKPLQHLELDEAIRRIQNPGHASLSLDDAMEEANVIDETKARAIFRDDDDAIVELIDLVMADVPRYVTRLSEHVAQGHWVEVAKTAHTIKGAAGNVSAVGVMDCARAIESMVARRAFAEAPDHVGALVDAVALLVQGLEAWKKRLRRSVFEGVA